MNIPKHAIVNAHAVKNCPPGIEGWSKWVPPKDGEKMVPPEGYLKVEIKNS